MLGHHLVAVQVQRGDSSPMAEAEEHVDEVIAAETQRGDLCVGGCVGW